MSDKPIPLLDLKPSPRDLWFAEMIRAEIRRSIGPPILTAADLRRVSDCPSAAAIRISSRQPLGRLVS